MREFKKKPQIRFPEFKESWEESLLSDFLTKYSENNSDNEFAIDDILSLSSIHGIVDRKELLEDTYSNVNHLNYKKTRLNDFVYGKSISSSYPFGLFKVNNCKDGLLSTLYFTFKVKDYVNPMFLDLYFSHLTRANNFLRKYVLVGDRYITADSDYLLSGKIYLPTQIDEQQKIASFLTVIDEKLQALKMKKTLLEQYKKGVMQKLFSQELRFKDENGKDFPDWEVKKLGEVLEDVIDNRGKTPPVVNDGIPLIEVNSIGGKNISFSVVSKYVDKQTYENWFRKYLKNGDVLFATVGNTALCSYYDGRLNAVIAQNIVGLRFANQIGLFMYYLLIEENNYKKMKSIEMGAVQPSIKVSQLKLLLFNIPSISEQLRISNFLSSIDEKINHINQKIEKTEVWKKGLLQKMFV